MVSSDLGKLEASRHFSSGAACASAGAASVPAAAAPTPAERRNLRRCMTERLRRVEFARAYGTQGPRAKASTHDQKNNRQCANCNSVPGEHAESMAADEAHEGTHHNQCRNERRQEPHRDQAAAMPVQRRPVLVEIV